MSKSPFIDFKKLKEQVGIRRILDHYQLTQNFKETGDRLSGPCPLCEGESESFRVSQEKNCYKCFRCDAGGNILDFVAAKEDCPIREAAVKIAEWFEVTTGKPASSKTGKKAPTEGKERASVESPKVPTPAAPETQKPASPAVTTEPKNVTTNVPLTFELKLDPEHPWFAQTGILPETVTEFGLGYCGKGFLAGRIAFPIHDLAGCLVGYLGRLPHEPASQEDLWKSPSNLDRTCLVFGANRLAGKTPASLRFLANPLEMVLEWQAGHQGCVSLLTEDIHLAQLKLLVSIMD